ncbi:MAG: C25 family cysteine peptidase, partial [Chloroflexota bacterium]
MTSYQGLEAQYGSENILPITDALNAVVSSSRINSKWDSNLIFVDDAENLDKYEIPPIKEVNAWGIKNLLRDLDIALYKRGERIGALLIVGGPKIIPFHRLPNPVDDLDTEVPSDNPYATTDDNYFIPNWPVGRIPGGSDNDASTLIHQLETIIGKRNTNQKKESKIKTFFNTILALLFKSRRPNPSFGYTAEIWRRASNAVFRPIGKPHTLTISPPSHAEEMNSKNLTPTQFAYFNLHGLEDTPDWYGQRDPIESPDGIDYPIALRPQDIMNSGSAPQIVFSEACYGANIIDKNVDDAISLKFLTSGSSALIGSTCTSYGSISSPLIAADLLGKYFWNSLNDGYP